MFQTTQTPLKGKIGVVLGSFAPLHRGHLDLIMRAKKENDGCVVFVSGYEGDKGSEVNNLNFIRRFRYVRELFANDPLINVYGIDEKELGIDGKTDEWDIWMQEASRLLNKIKDAESFVFYVAEHEYAEPINRYHRVILLEKELKISGTMIRRNPLKYWKYIVGPFKRAFSTNILVTGTASEGKSTLVEDLGKYFDAPYSYEWARKYIEESSIAEEESNVEDFLAYIEGQHNLNKRLINSPANNGLFIADTDSLVTKMYAERYHLEPGFALGKKGDLELVQKSAILYAEKSTWDTIFLLVPKNVFVDDGLRYMAHGDMGIRREMAEALLKDIELYANYKELVILDGDYYTNFLKAKDHIERKMNGDMHE